MRFLVVVAAARAATEDCTRAVFELRLDAAVARQAQEDTIETKPTFTPSDAPPPGRPLVPPETTYPPDDGGAEEEKASPVRPLVYEPEEESIVPLDEPLAPPTPVTPFVFEDVEPRERALVPPPGARPPVDAPTYTPVQDFAYRVRGSPRTPAYSAYGLAPAAGHLAPLPRSTPISEFDARRNSWIDPAAPPVNSNRRAGELLPRPPTYATPTYRSPGPYHTPSRPGSSRAPATPLTASTRGDRPPPPPEPSFWVSTF
ncbi:hypothetical protein JL720_923 [Aureococcus anophagefferens]|nr:hypothetical protein JL720_923 [Aureococcus anophagefferens]